MSNGNATDVMDALSAGAASAEPKAARQPEAGESAPFVVIPKDYRVEDLSRLFPEPQRRRGSVALLDADSFIRHITTEREVSQDSLKPGKYDMRLYGVKGEKPGFTAVFNDEGYSDHRATYACPMARQWTAWKGANGKAMTQVQFAEFIENNRLDIVEPSTADMLEVAQNIQATSSGNFKQKINRTSGAIEFAWADNTTATAGEGRMAVPETFKIAIPVFEGGDKWSIVAKLRYRIKEGNLSLWFDLDSVDEVLETALAEVWKAIEDHTALKIFHGSPATGRTDRT